jgi:tetrahydromethanopterin S-methyltransferase subunit G
VEDKTYDLLAKMYGEFSELKDEFKDLKSKVARIEIKLEHNIEPKIQVLFEDRDGIHKKLDSIEQKVDVLADRVDKQDIRISVLKGGKPKANKG